VTEHVITAVRVHDRRFPLPPGTGSDALHRDVTYAYAVTELVTDAGIVGTGLAFTLGAGTELVCAAASALAARLVGRPVEELMASFGDSWRAMADDPYWRWLGPHSGVVHLALASVANACFDCWAQVRGVPLWRLLLDLDDDAFLALFDLHQVDDVLSPAEARALLATARASRATRTGVLRDGHPGYDTSVGWLGYDESRLRDEVMRARDDGFRAVKLKVGSAEPARDIRRAALLRELLGDDAPLMLDANQRWGVREAIVRGTELAPVRPFWLEEPTHPADVLGHATIAAALPTVPVACGEHVPNAVAFKNFLQARGMAYCQVDAVRVGGVGEFLAVALLAARHGVPVVPHVGDMGQLHQHLVLVTHVALGLPVVFLEHIPHLREHFADPALVRDGTYVVPQRPGASMALRS
jgi:L-fuconate dehydratase